MSLIHGILESKKEIVVTVLDSIVLSPTIVWFLYDGTPCNSGGTPTGEDNVITIISSGPWQVSYPSGTWASVIPESGDGSGTATVYAEYNGGEETRSMGIRFTCGVYQDIGVTQFAQVAP